MTRHDRRIHGKTKTIQDKTRQGNIRSSKGNKQYNIIQDNINQAKLRQDNTTRYKTKQDNAGQCMTIPLNPR